MVIVGKVPHFGEIVFGSKGQVSPGEAEVHAKNKLVIFSIFPQVYEIGCEFKLVTVPPGSGPTQPVMGYDVFKVPLLPSYSSSVPQKAKEVLVDPVVLLIDNVNVLLRIVL